MSESMIESVARAMFERRRGNRAKIKWDETHPHTRKVWRENAALAIEAMREPTELMSNEGWDAAQPMVVSYGFAIGGAEMVWNAMIDAALAAHQASPKDNTP